MSTSAYRDQNNVPTIIAGQNSSGTPIGLVQATPATHLLKVNDGTSGSDYGPTDDLRDENSVPALMAVSSGDGQTPIVLYVTSDGKLLIDSV